MSFANQDGTDPSRAQIVIQNHMPKQPFLSRAFYNVILWGSIGLNLIMLIGFAGLVSKNIPNEEIKEGELLAPNKIVVIDVKEMITTESVAAPIKELKNAAKDKEVKGVVVAVSSPGGTISGSDELYEAIKEFVADSHNKPLVVSMQGMATSGGYYISAPADQIFADPTCLTGSIGVILSMFNVKELTDKYGIKVQNFTSGPMKDSGSPFKAMTPEEEKHWQDLVDKMYGRFLDVILATRQEKVGGEDKLRELADGRVYIATKALDLGLIDKLGYERDAIASCKQLAGITNDDEVKVVRYRRPIDNLLDLLNAESSISKMQSGSEQLQRFLKIQGQPLFLPPNYLTP